MTDEQRAQLRGSAAHLFVAPEVLDIDGVVPLDSDTEHHLTRVLRLRDGESVSVTDGAGRWRIARFVGDGGTSRLEMSGEINMSPEISQPLTVAVAIPKGDRLDWMVQKATELGVDHIQLLHARRSVVRWKPDRVDKQLSRLQRIADEAARQSRRLYGVVIAPPLDAISMIGGAVIAEPGGRAIGPSDHMVAIGPEGGWSPEELDAAGERIDLGPNILRTETAALVAITLSVARRH